MLKVVRQPGDEWRSGDVLRAFGARGTVRVLEHVDGALLLERLTPGTPLVEIVLSSRDAEATEIAADVITAMAPAPPTFDCPTVEDWAAGFIRYLESTDHRIPRDLVREGARFYTTLCASQRNPRLLHGDLQHYNILRDDRLGWVAIDPKGVIGEVEFELGALLRNPTEQPDVFADAAIILRRLETFRSRLGIDVRRAMAWAFAQSVLSAIWQIEDGGVGPRNAPSLDLARAIRPLLDGAPVQHEGGDAG